MSNDSMLPTAFIQVCVTLYSSELLMRIATPLAFVFDPFK